MLHCIKLLFRVLVLSTFIFQSQAQTVRLTGKVVDGSGEPLINANVLAIPENEELDITYSITNKKGEYRLKLLKNQVYNVTVSFLGFDPNLTVVKQDSTTRIKNFVLNESITNLEEVVVKYKVPIQIKEDTIIYDVESFANGSEKKLKDLLKKLPGVEVDRDGSVWVKGAKVTKLLVEGKVFFTGNSKLATKNIPADAVDEIEVIEDYHRVGFLKGLQTNNDLALNIKLKEDKKKFAFGDIDLGLGAKDHYVLHPNVFYYSPKTNINFIGDLNNLGIRSFTLSDYINFEGGFGKLMMGSKGYSVFANNDLVNFLNNDDFKFSKDAFGAINIRQVLSKKMEINSYVIANSNKTETEVRALNQYNTDDVILENRISNGRLNDNFVLGKTNINFKPSKSTDLETNSFFKSSKGSYTENTSTSVIQETNTFVRAESKALSNFKQNIEFNKQISKKHTLSTEGLLSLSRQTIDGDWTTDQTFLESLIPIVEDDVYVIQTLREKSTINLEVLLKNYWVLNNYNHIYTSLGGSLASYSYNSEDSQVLSNNSINSFSNAGFNNNLSSKLNDFYFGLEYKVMLGIFTIHPNIYFHNFSWQNKQVNNLVSNKMSTLLPSLKIDSKINNNEKIKLKYNLNVRFPDIESLGSNLLLSNFNQIVQGDSSLMERRFHTLSLSYSKYSLFRGINFNSNVSYNKKTRGYKLNTRLLGIEQFRKWEMFGIPEDNVSLLVDFGKRKRQIKYGLRVRANYNDFFQLSNSTTTKNISKSIAVRGKIESFFKTSPNFQIGYEYSPSNYKTFISDVNIVNQEFFGNIEAIVFKNFVLKSNYKRINFRNKTLSSSNFFDLLNSSIVYNKEDSPWSFELAASNIFDNKFKRESSFNDFLVTDRRVFVVPRIILCKFSYKF